MRALEDICQWARARKAEQASRHSKTSEDDTSAKENAILVPVSQNLITSHKSVSSLDTKSPTGDGASASGSVTSSVHSNTYNQISDTNKRRFVEDDIFAEFTNKQPRLHIHQVSPQQSSCADEVYPIESVEAAQRTIQEHVSLVSVSSIPPIVIIRPGDLAVIMPDCSPGSCLDLPVAINPEPETLWRAVLDHGIDSWGGLLKLLHLKEADLSPEPITKLNLFSMNDPLSRAMQKHHTVSVFREVSEKGETWPSKRRFAKYLGVHCLVIDRLTSYPDKPWHDLCEGTKMEVQAWIHGIMNHGVYKELPPIRMVHLCFIRKDTELVRQAIREGEVSMRTEAMRGWPLIWAPIATPDAITH